MVKSGIIKNAVSEVYIEIAHIELYHLKHFVLRRATPRFASCAMALGMVRADSGESIATTQ